MSTKSQLKKKLDKVNHEVELLEADLQALDKAAKPEEACNA